MGRRKTELQRATRRFRLPSPTASVALGVLALLLLALDVPLEVVAPAASPSGSDVWSNLTWFAFGLSFTAVGVTVARRESRNPIGWLVLATEIAVLLSSDGGEYAYLDYGLHHGSLPLGHVALLLSPAFFYAFLLMPLIILLFPDGRLGSRWRWPLRAYLVLLVAFIAGTLSVAVADFHVHLPVDSSGNLVGLNHPFGGNRWVGPILGLSFISAGLLAVAAVVYQVRAYHRANGDRSQQLKWLGVGAVVCVVALSVALMLRNAPNWVDDILFFAGLIALPVSIGVGILRYRLYEIDRLISRTLSYAILTGLLVGTFIGLITLTTDALALSGRVGVAASTLVAAALFEPLRKRVQRLVDRRFNRARYDAETIVAAFTTRLRDAVEIDTISADLLETVNRALQPTQASVWIKP